MTYIENFDCPAELSVVYDVFCPVYPASNTTDDQDKPIHTKDSFDDIKFTLCGTSSYLDFLYYADIKTDISSSAEAEENNQYLWGVR